ncbi:MAG: TFIIB-type zinc ribbon-containing protein [Thermoplasmata archaeon]|nr:TFIIB-type zinc ribbon-containing protein [Thermoplasmata archaeon]
MRHRRPRKGKRVLRCPQCNSDHLVYEGALIMGQVYHCLDCDYIGSFVIETDEAEPAPPLKTE